MSLLLASAARATVGARSGQEDSFRVWPAGGLVRSDAQGGLLAVLADGMGGHTGGAIAGETACAAFADTFAASATPYEERLQSALRASNEALARGVEQNAALRGMGCTLVAAWIDAAGMRWTSVGDSLLLLYRFPEVIRLNADHSLGYLLDEQARQNIITPSEAKAHLNRNALRSALTGARIELVDMHGEPLELRPSDWIVLASDGICSLGGDELANVIGRHRHATPEAMAEGLIDAVLAKGIAGQDNTTVVVVRVDSAEPVPFDEVTTRVIVRPAPSSQPGDDGASTPATEKRSTSRSLFTGAFGVSPAVWLGVAIGLLFIAIAMALRAPPVQPSPASGPPPMAVGAKPADTPPPTPPAVGPPDAAEATGAPTSSPRGIPPQVRAPGSRRPEARDLPQKRDGGAGGALDQ
jgi:protein phosphatase